ncbi:MAG: helix-turn-helix domain-containing protein [Bacteroidaceae bacterium]|nr:helix-turn-helix domain-containing protein [Bacteroidaceae bacterium]
MPRQRRTGKLEPVQKKWLSANEAMAYLGCSRNLLLKLRNEGEVSFSVYGGKTIWYELNSIEKFLERNKVI